MCITEYDESRAFAEQREEGVLDILSSLVKDGILTSEDAAKRADIIITKFKLKSGLK